MKPIITVLTLLLATVLAKPVYAANFYWIANSSAFWNSTSNWSTSSGGPSGAGIPGRGAVAIFDNNGVGNCTLSSAPSVTIDELVMNTGYTGTITQDASTAVVISTAAVFSGATATFADQINMNGPSWTYVSGKLNMAPGTVVTFSNNVVISGSHTLAAVNFSNSSGVGIVITLSSGTVLTLTGDFTMSGSSPLTFSGGIINIFGSMSLTNTSMGGGGTSVLNLTAGGGAGSSQNINSNLPFG